MEKITISMTNTAPVRIDPELWPIVAEGSSRAWEGEHDFQANRKWSVRIEVRQHADGRRILAGRYQFVTNWQAEAGVKIHAGYVLSADADIVEWINAVGEGLASCAAEEESEGFRILRDSVRECIESLPPIDM